MAPADNLLASSKDVMPSTSQSPLLAPSTPPMRSRRSPRTPPAPAHGAFLEHYEPYPSTRSSRTEKRSPPPTMGKHSIPSGEAQLSTPRRHAVKKLGSAHLASPPSSPVREALLFDLSTPRRSDDHLTTSPRTLAGGSTNKQSSSLAVASLERLMMLPTPSKTPSKSRAKPMTPHAINFQTDNANDLMPRPRKIKTEALRSQPGAHSFQLYDDEDSGDSRAGKNIDVFTDANARVPELDASDENPFVGPARSSTAKRSPKRSKKSAEQVIEEAIMDEAVARGEGMVFTFRGKKMFRPFDNVPQRILSPVRSIEQHGLRRAAGSTSKRPFTRSQMQPRLLFPPANRFEDQRHQNTNSFGFSGNDSEANTDSEADTDIEENGRMIASGEISQPVVMTYGQAESSSPAEVLRTPAKTHNAPASPHTTAHRSSRRLNKEQLRSIPEDRSPAECASGNDRDVSPVAMVASKKTRSSNPFDSWKRTKSRTTTSPAKRGADSLEGSSIGGPGKRTRSTERRGLATP